MRFDTHGQAGTVQLPSSALVFRAQGTQVATVGPGDRIRMLPVTIGRDLGPAVEVTSGLSAGQRVVDNPPDSITQGELVRVGAATRG